MLLRIQKQGLDVTPRILIVTRLIPDEKGTSCNQRLERVSGTQYTHILRVPFRSDKGVLRKWISRFDVWAYLEKFTEDSKGEEETQAGAKQSKMEKDEECSRRTKKKVYTLRTTSTQSAH